MWPFVSPSQFYQKKILSCFWALNPKFIHNRLPFCFLYCKLSSAFLGFMLQYQGGHIHLLDYLTYNSCTILSAYHFDLFTFVFFGQNGFKWCHFSICFNNCISLIFVTLVLQESEFLSNLLILKLEEYGFGSRIVYSQMLTTLNKYSKYFFQTIFSLLSKL